MTTITNHADFEFQSQRLDDHSIEPEQAKQKLSKGQSLSTLLRVFGACAVIASLSLFLIEGWKDGNDLSRYFKLLAQTGLITGAGLFLSFVVKEVKGARVFFGLGLVSAVANFTILGALTYSIFALDNALGEYSSMLKWQAVSLTEFLPLAVGAIVLLSLLSRFSFSIFARNSASKLTLTFLALNALLMVPAREALYASVLAAIALFVATQVTLSIVKRKELLLTREAKYALACLFLPGLIIICRALGLYAVEEVVLLTLFSLIYYALRNVSITLRKQTKPGLQKVLSIFQYLSGITAAGLLAGLVPHQADVICFAVFSLVSLGVTYDQTKIQQVTNAELSGVYILLTTLALLAVNLLAAMAWSSITPKLLSLGVLIATFSVNTLFTNSIPNLRTSQLLALIGIAAASMLVLVEFITMLNVGSWVLIGGLGIGLIVIASLYERFGITFKLPSTEQGA